MQIAVDILIATSENRCERFCLVSSETDFIPAIHKAQEKGKIAVYVSFSHQISRALVANGKVTQTLTRETLLPFVEKKAT